MWLWLALGCALLVGIGDILSKWALRNSSERIVGLGRLLFSLPILGLAFWLNGVPRLSAPFWVTLSIMLPFEVAAYLLYLRAIKIAPLSLTVPFLALTPVFTIVTSAVLLGEHVSRVGAAGIFAVAAGAYLLHLESPSQGWWSPFFALFREPGSRFMIFAAFFYSITSNLGKRSIQLSNPYTFAFVYQLMNILALWLLTVGGKGENVSIGKEIRLQWKVYIALGTVMAFAVIAHCVAISKVPVPYFIAIKRTSLMVGVLSGGMLFHERKMAQRLAATLLMVLGVALIALFP